MRISLLSIVLLISATASANVGIPVVSFGLPFLLANLILIVLIESLVLYKLHSGLRPLLILKHLLIANLITTLIGYPVVAIFIAMGAIFNLNLGWLVPYADLAEMDLYISLSLVATLLPCYFLSVWVEGRWLKRKIDPKITWKQMHLIHLASYSFLLVQVFTQFPIRLLNYASYTFETSYTIVMGIIYYFSWPFLNN